MTGRAKHRGERLPALFGFDGGTPTEQPETVEDNPLRRPCPKCGSGVAERCTRLGRGGRKPSVTTRQLATTTGPTAHTDRPPEVRAVADHMFVGDAESGPTMDLRQRAVEMIEQAGHPRLVPSGPEGWVHEDTRRADREAQLALAAAMVYLGDIIAAHGGDDA